MSVLTRIHPDMKPIIPSPGGRATPCSVSYRKLGGRFCLCVSLAKATAYEMGFNVSDPRAENWAEVGVDGKTGTLVVVNVSDSSLPTNDVVRWRAQLRQGTIVIVFRPDWLNGYDTVQPAERCEFKVLSERVGTVDAKYIEITLPAWAAPKRQVAQVTTVVEPAKSSRLLDSVPHVRPGAPAR